VVSGHGLVGIGYEGQDIAAFVEALTVGHVTRLVDVRLTPLSRKRGFGKTALTAVLADAGIAYEHFRALGNPKDNRPGFSGSPEDLRTARAVYEARLDTSEARAAIAGLVEAARRERVAVLCFEADQARCHRDVVLAVAAGLLA